MIWHNTVCVQQVVSWVVHLCNYYYPYSSTLDIRGGPGVSGCTLLSHEGFVDHKRAMKETNIWGPEMNTATTFVDLAFTRLAIFQGGNSSEALRGTHGALKAISPQSSGWNPLQLNNFLHLVSIPHWHPFSIITLLSWHQSQPLSGSLLLPE